MIELENLVKEWYRARTELLRALAARENLKPKGNGMEAIEPSPISDLWISLSNAEWKLSDFMKESDD
jgi:hypothetical protein